MSGGYFNYKQYQIGEIIESIESAILQEELTDSDESNGFSTDTINEFKNAVSILKCAELYAQRIDWLMSGDDGEDSFHRRLKDDMEGLLGD